MPAAAAAFLNAPPARADQVKTLDDDWRRQLADGYLKDGATFKVRSLQDGLELWETPGGGYMVVETTQQALLEGSATAWSPYSGCTGDLAYLGPGKYFAYDTPGAVDLITGEVSAARELRVIARDAAGMARDTLHVAPMDAERISAWRTKNDPTAAVAQSSGGGGLTPVKSGDVKYRVPSYSYITGCHVYPNTTGTCGWVAGSIVTRYWHARSSARKLLPTKYRSGTNLTSSPNFATYLKGSKGDSSVAWDLKERLAWNASNQGVAYAASWALGNIGMFSQVESGWPVIVFGSLPVGNNKKGTHAVVGYGTTKSGYLITHYGWSGYTDIVLNGGIIGSNARFRLT
ncbi:MAG: hypothetical protein LBE08_12590 [Bifidobacteriaceae bacterium]|nr:hypothetical protein [Bifidobacteriaceae bacterium]